MFALGRRDKPEKLKDDEVGEGTNMAIRRKEMDDDR